MIIELAISQLLLALFNIGNAHFDAYRISKNKSIAHGINFAAYFIFVAAWCWVLKLELKFWYIFDVPVFPRGQVLLFAVIAFLNRQFSFDIPLNLKRGLDWNYQSTANPPKAALDIIERFLFGQGEKVGTIIFVFYLGCYIATVTAFLIVYG